MVVGVLSSIISAAVLATASLLWRHRLHLALLRTTLYPRGLVRVSFAALLRVKDDDAYLLVNSTTRPGFHGPPGGVFKYHDSADDALDHLGFREQRLESHREHMREDLRGFVPARSALGFVRWFATGCDRETGPECLRRELSEELEGALGDDQLGDVRALTFKRVRTVTEGPRRVPRQSFRQLRRFEIYDLAVTDEASARFRRQLIERSRDPSIPALLRASSAEIAAGWCGATPIAPQSAYLFGPRKLLPDLPPMPLAASLIV